jgi:formylglycine-generating enzyme required for sulfatase activity
MIIEIYPHTIHEYRTWQEAHDLCQSLEGGWRLPTIEELDYIHQLGQEDRLTLGNYGVWGEKKDQDWAWSKGFHTGNTYLNPLDNLNLLLPVRNAKEG